MYALIFFICFQSGRSFPEGEFRNHCAVQSESKVVSWSIRRVCLSFHLSAPLTLVFWNAMVLFIVIFAFLYISLFCNPYTLIIYFLSLLNEFLVTTILYSCLFYFLFLCTMFSFVPLSSLMTSFWSKVLKCCF